VTGTEEAAALILVPGNPSQSVPNSKVDNLNLPVLFKGPVSRDKAVESKIRPKPGDATSFFRLKIGGFKATARRVDVKLVFSGPGYYWYT
jgi:hypothetical protein